MHLDVYARWYNGGYKRINLLRRTICLEETNWELDGAWKSSSFALEPLSRYEWIINHRHDIFPLTLALPMTALDSQYSLFDIDNNFTLTTPFPRTQLETTWTGTRERTSRVVARVRTATVRNWTFINVWKKWSDTIKTPANLPLTIALCPRFYSGRIKAIDILDEKMVWNAEW